MGSKKEKKKKKLARAGLREDWFVEVLAEEQVCRISAHVHNTYDPCLATTCELQLLRAQHPQPEDFTIITYMHYLAALQGSN